MHRKGLDMQYKNWQITKIHSNIWKATKDDKQINVSSARLLRALIDENESRLPYAKKPLSMDYEDQAKVA
jgi:hypothetical protein